jgi:hypothetical protein
LHTLHQTKTFPSRTRARSFPQSHLIGFSVIFFAPALAHTKGISALGEQRCKRAKAVGKRDSCAVLSDFSGSLDEQRPGLFVPLAI